MDRRVALKKLGIGGATVLGVSAVMSSPAFADGGSVTCRSTPAIANALGATTNTKRSIAVSSTRTTFDAATCGCGGWAATVQRRWEATGPSAVGIYDAATDGTQLSSAFGTAGASVTIPATVYLHEAGNGNLGAGNYTVDLTVRHVCRQGSNVAWSCQRFRVALAWNTSGPDGTITTSASTTFEPPDNTAACDNPAP